MAYFAALISLKLTIRRLLLSSQLSILPASRGMLGAAYEAVGCFQKFLQANEGIIIGNSNNGRVKSLNEQTRDAAHKLEDALESHVSNQSERLGDEGFSPEIFLDLEEVKEEINSFIETVNKIEKMMEEAVRQPLLEEGAVVPSKIDFRGKTSKMVGLSEEFIKFKRMLLHDPPGCDVVPIVGMAGIGKTTFAMKILEDPSISSHFGLRAFVTVGQKYQFRELLLSILSQINRDIDEIRMEEDKKLAEHVRISLQGRRYLIVLDDVWNGKGLNDLLSLLRSRNNNSSVLLTTRLEQVARYPIHHMRFLNKKESWDLLREKVFGEGNLCPFELEKPGKKIAENCEGLPLLIIMVANILCKGEKTLEYWEKVAKKENSVFTDAYDLMLPVLIPSYNYLPQYLKPCFLYMGIFPQSYEIPVSNLVKLWRAEGFLDFYSLDGFENFAMVCLWDLVAASILLVTQWSSRWPPGAKTCKLHSVFWHLCVKQAGSEKFLHVMNRYASGFSEGIKYQRRLCIHNNVLFGIKEVYNSMDPISTVHSLLCTGAYHQYPVPICFGLRLLRVLDALTIRFYKFPIELLKLVRLRYLALTCSGKVPGSVSKLWNLEHLIIFRHMIINKSSRDSSYLPMEIWNMKELRHIQVTGSNLQHPCGAALPNLLTLSNISASSCSKEILERTPNLTRLGIQIELTPDVVEPSCCFDHLSNLRYLESLKCVVVNPKPRSQAFAPITTFPSHLSKLSLSGLGYPWKYMRIIGEMPNLQVLKLRCYAFQGPVWEVSGGEFLQLRHLLLEDTDLVHWTSDKSFSSFLSDEPNLEEQSMAYTYCCFPSLQHLIIRHCYKLNEIPLSFGSAVMEVVDCPSLGACIRVLEREFDFTRIHVHSSLGEVKGNQDRNHSPCSSIHVHSSLGDEDES